MGYADVMQLHAQRITAYLVERITLVIVIKVSTARCLDCYHQNSKGRLEVYFLLCDE